MTIKEQITQELEKLPEPLLQEILDFVQFLQAKHQQIAETKQIQEHIESETHTQIKSTPFRSIGTGMYVKPKMPAVTEFESLH